MRPQRQLLGHIGDDIRLADGLPAGDRQRLVGIGGVGKTRLDEMPARHFVHGAQHRLVGDAAPAQRQQEFHAADVLVVLRWAGTTLLFAPLLARLRGIHLGIGQVSSSPPGQWNLAAMGQVVGEAGAEHERHPRSATRFSWSRTNISSACCWRICSTDLGYEIAAAVGTIAEASEFAAQRRIRRRHSRRQSRRPGDLSGGRNSGAARPALRVRHRLWRSSLSEPYRDRPALQKPFQAEQLKTLAALLATA